MVPPALMTPGQETAVVVGLVLTALFGIITYLLKERFDAQDDEIHEMRTVLDAHSVALAGLQESQKAVVSSQSAVSDAHRRLIENAEDLEDVTDQLQDATRHLRERLEKHEEWHRQLHSSPGLGVAPTLGA